MKNYKNESPTFSEEISIFEATDPVDAESVDNVPLKQLADNDNCLKGQLDNIGLATTEEVQEVADDLMDGFDFDPSDSPVSGDIATDEDIQEVIEELDDL